MNRPLFGRLPLCLALIALILISSSAVVLADDQSLAKMVDGIFADPALARSSQGVYIQSLKDNRVLYDKNSDLLLVPASNFKLVVSSAALDLLGPDYKMQTSLYITAQPSSDGFLKGDVVIVGQGDPVFAREHLQEMADKIKSMGIKTIQGSIVGDDTWFDEQRLGDSWSWDYESYYYAAQISGLNLDENVVGVWVRPGSQVNASASVSMVPDTKYLIVQNEITTSPAGSKPAIDIRRVRARNIIRATGTVPADYKPTSAEEAITMEDPTLYTCRTLTDMLRSAGVTVRGVTMRGKKPQNATLVMTHDSPPMSQMLALLLKPSDNLIAECLLKTLGAEMEGRGSSSAGERVELDFIKKIGGDPGAISIADGSGLSRMDMVTPRTLATILTYMYRHKDSKVYMDALPVAGVDGTIRNRMKGTPAQGNARAKTGYIGRVRSLSGIVTTKSGEPIVFSMMTNNHSCSSAVVDAMYDRIVVALASMGE